MTRNLTKFGFIRLVGLGLLICVPGIAHSQLVTNGGFETTTGLAKGQLDDNTFATGWTTGGANVGYNFLFTPGSADTSGALGQYGQFYLWGPHDGSNNGLLPSSPAGGNYVALDGAFHTSALTQTINGLTVGKQYAVTFEWAGAQQDGYNGATTDKFIVGLGSQTFTTPILSNPSHGFTGWKGQSFVYTATATSETLSFLAAGTPSGLPPFSLLDGVSMNVVPESSTRSMMLFVFASCFCVFGLRRIRATKRNS